MRELIFKSLETVPLFNLVDAFNAAFADYFVPFQVDQTYLYDRWRVARVDYRLSVGAFEKDRLVAFVVFGVDRRDGIVTAHNVGTGVIPAFRGQRLVEKMFEVAIPLLRASGVQQTTLEVITDNEKAIRAYSRVGYRITRRLLCFDGELHIEPALHSHLVRTTEIPLSDSDQWVAPRTWESSTEFLRLAQKNYECWFVPADAERRAYVILNPETGFVFRFAFVKETLEPDGRALFEAIRTQRSFIKVNNIDENDEELVALLRSVGLQNPINQYEMSMDL